MLSISARVERLSSGKVRVAVSGDAVGLADGIRTWIDIDAYRWDALGVDQRRSVVVAVVRLALEGAPMVEPRDAG